MGDLQFENGGGGVHVTTLVAPTWPAYASGLEMDDELKEVDGQNIAAEADVQTALAKHQPGDAISIVFVDRRGESTTGRVTLAGNPHVEAVPVESTSGGMLTDAQRTFRQRWLGSK